MNKFEAGQKEELRHAALEYLAARHPAAMTVRACHRTIAREIGSEITEEDVEAALELLAALRPPLAACVRDALGATKYWRATATGVLAFERGEIPDQPSHN
jgi:hypothetical protein